MSAESYTLLGPLYPAEKCYLFEVLLWRAFARLPESQIIDEGEDWRFASDVRDGYAAPILNGEELSERECEFAGIPPDPRYEALFGDGEFTPVEHLDRMIAMIRGFDPPEPDTLKEFLDRRSRAVEYQAHLADWLPYLSDYTDQFKNEICLSLQRGELTAFATELPHVERDESDKILEGKGIWVDELPVKPIEKEGWISSGIDWDASALIGRGRSYVWVHLVVEEVLRVFPPSILISKSSLKTIGGNFALVSNALSEATRAATRRGRPSLPWEDFHVEVARMFRDGQMPSKKEAAIAALQQWFVERHGKSVSRAAIGQRLKAYYDALVRQDRK